MVISKERAKKLIDQKKAIHIGYTVTNGYIWAIINRWDIENTSHVKMTRTMATNASEVNAWPKW